jgi:nucleotide-binding universal stress UspA family protein
MKTLLVLTDFSAASDGALAQAERLARSSGAEVHLFHKVVYPPPYPTDLDRLDDVAKLDYVLKEVLERPEREAREALEQRVSRLRDRGLAVRPHLERSGDVYESAEAAIDSVKPDLVIMGTHGRSGVRKWLMGSVAEKVLRH